MLDPSTYPLPGRRLARNLAPAAYHDLLDLWRFRLVEVTAKGRSITEVYVDITSRLEQPLKVVLSHGTAFRAAGLHQNMATRREEAFLLPARGTKYLTVAAACIDAGRPIPGARNGFHGVEKVLPPVERFLRESDGSPATVAQAGIWAITDGYTREQISIHPVSASSRGGISDPDINLACSILNRLDIRHQLN